MSDDNNVFQLVKSPAKDGLPSYPYVLETIDNEFKELEGFPVFTPQYLMIMREFPGEITAPVFMIPIDRIKSFEFDEDVIDEDDVG